MEGFRLYLLQFLIAALNIIFANVMAQKSAIFSRIQTVQNRVSPTKVIECALHLMILKNNSYFRIAEGTGICEILQRPQSYQDFFKSGFEYFEISTKLSYYKAQMPLKERVEHYIYPTVNLHDKFSFVIKKTGIDRMGILFSDSSGTDILVFSDSSTVLRLFDRIGGDNGAVEKPSYPLSNFKIYKILFEADESHWKIFVDDTLITTFQHRHSITMVREIIVNVGYKVTYLTKTLQPRI